MAVTKRTTQTGRRLWGLVCPVCTSLRSGCITTRKSDNNVATDNDNGDGESGEASRVR